MPTSRHSFAKLYLKLIRLGGDLGPADHARFVREAEVISRFEHLRIVRIYRVGEYAGRPYILMELLRGRTLEEVIANEDVPTRQKLLWLEQLCDGLAHVHAKDIVHRDIKPSNLMVDGDGLKIFDFGIARTRNANLTNDERNQLIGTPRYMSPEQISEDFVPVRADGSRGLDGRSDLFSVGSVAYELWAREHAFPGQQFQALTKVIEISPPPLSCIFDGFDPLLS